MKTLLIFILFIFSMNGYGQDSSIVKPADSNSVFVHKDPRIDSLVKKQAFINEVTSREGRRTDKGFRILIISTNKRDEALSAKSKIYSFFPELKAYLWYQSPYFRVKAGNFKERKDAEAYQRRLNVYFPKGVFIMKDDDVEMKNGKGLNDKSTTKSPGNLSD